MPFFLPVSVISVSAPPAMGLTRIANVAAFKTDQVSCNVRQADPPGENLISTDAVPAGDERHAHTGEIRLLDDPDLFLRCPPPPALNTGENLAIVVTPGRTVSHMAHSYLRAGPCQVI